MRRCARGRRPKGRNNSGTSTDQFCRVRAARSGGGPKAQRAGPAVRRTAEAQHFLSDSSSARPPAPAYGVRCAPRTAIPLRIALLALQAVEACGAHSNVSCGPPRPEASARATRWVARAQPKAQPTSSAQSSPQFSAPCPPHCGSAIAPPVPLGTRKLGVSTPNRRPRQFCLSWPSANRQNMPFKRAGDGFWGEIEFSARLRDSSIFGYRRNS